MRRLALVLFLAGCGVEAAPAPESTLPPPDPDLEAWVASLPDTEAMELDRETATMLVTLPLACVDRPHSPPRERLGYLDDRTSRRRNDYEETRAFYGCYDWHSAVNSTWAMVAVLRRFPDLPVAPLIREKLNDHLKASALEGEQAFFEESRTFERPYGWAWYMLLQQEALFNDEDARTWAENMAPLARTFAERTLEYLDGLAYPIRVGTHANTAFALEKMLAYARAVGDEALEEAIVGKAREFYLQDRDCPVDYEPSGSDFLSPCLEEAKLMAEVLEPAEFAAWYRDFMPPTSSAEFAHVTARVRADEMEIADEEDMGLAGAHAHLVGLAFTRADAMSRIAGALPEGDPTAEGLRKLAALQGREGYEALFDADYLGTHWIASFALSYLVGEADAAAERADG